MCCKQMLKTDYDKKKLQQQTSDAMMTTIIKKSFYEKYMTQQASVIFVIFDIFVVCRKVFVLAVGTECAIVVSLCELTRLLPHVTSHMPDHLFFCRFTTLVVYHSFASRQKPPVLQILSPQTAFPQHCFQGLRLRLDILISTVFLFRFFQLRLIAVDYDIPVSF